MSKLNLTESASPFTPSSGQGSVYLNVDDKTLHLKDDTGADSVIGGGGSPNPSANLLLNRDFRTAQRQDPLVATVYDDASNRLYGPDRWAFTNETATLKFNPVDVSGARETNLNARYYGLIEKGGASGKYVVSQVIEADLSEPYAGRTVTFQMKAANNVNTHTLRMALLSYSGTADSLPTPFVAAWGGASVDPTWGVNIAQITPTAALGAGVLAGSGITCTLTSGWVTFGGTFVVPANCTNLIAVVYTDTAAAAAGKIGLSEMGVVDGNKLVDFVLRPAGVEFNDLLRYYWKTFRPPTPPADNLGSHTTGALHYYNVQTGAVAFTDTPTFHFPVPMRYKAPTGLIFDTNFTGGHLRNTTRGSVSSSETIHSDNIHTFYITHTPAFDWAPGDDIWFQASFDAEI